MLHGILRVSRRDHMRDEDIRRILQLAPINEVVYTGRPCPNKRCKRRHPYRVMDLKVYRCQTSRTCQEDMDPTDRGRHDGCGCYPGHALDGKFGRNGE